MIMERSLWLAKVPVVWKIKDAESLSNLNGVLKHGLGWE
jgi:hypothetical protein